MKTKSYVAPKSARTAEVSGDASLRSLVKGYVLLPDLAVVQLLRDIAKGIDSPLARRVEQQIASRDYAGLLANAVDPSSYEDSEAYFWDNQLCKLLSKYPSFPIISDDERSARTLANARACEVKCRDTNALFSAWDRGLVSLRPFHARVIEGARKLIAEVLGPFNPDTWLDNCRWGPGVNAFLPKSTSDYSKLTTAPSVTEEFLPYAAEFIAEFPAWARALNPTYDDPSVDSVTVTLNVAHGGKYAEVPKKALIGRDIETQPSINGFAQRGLGVMIAERLMAVGIDLSDQTANQELARIGSIDGSLATIDLTNASNTVAAAPVQFLLPSDWLHALSITRTTCILQEGKWVKLHRFSSMGNGFTFELETLIFWALARTVSDIKVGKKAVVSCFGDDIIVDTRVYHDVCGVLSVVGFEANMSKSFASGPFRESCGADWYRGRPVRPLYIDEDPHNVASLISLCNGLRRASARAGDVVCHHRGFRSAWLRAVRWIPSSVRRRLAFGNAEDDSFLLCHRIRDGFRVVAKSQQDRTSSWHGSVATALYRAYARKAPDPRLYVHLRAQALIRGLKQPLVVASRDVTVYGLAHHRHDTLWRGGRAQWS